ncbi:MAG: DUF4445 domain-containing protein [Clostridia bacterium]|nr:DUF4445 domain-containing protein [Clostridia bacterium]
MPTVVFNDISYIVPEGSRISDLPPYKESAALPCGGHGKCGKCKVTAKGMLSPLSATEREGLTSDEIESGVRLACCTTVCGDCVICTLDARTSARIRIAGDMPEISLHPAFSAYGVCVDIGTTTLAARLYNGEGTLLAEAGGLNPQSAYGADVISRIEAALKGEAHELAMSIRRAIDALLTELTRAAGIAPNAIDGMVITGNTVMLHLLTETSVEPLSHAPFAAERLFGEVLTAGELALTALSPDAEIYLPPCAAAFVGADITTALLASGICGQQGTALLVDIGTNGEMALWHDGRLTFCSTAAGPAFEGADISMGMGGKEGAIDSVCLVNGSLYAHVIGNIAPAGICGSGVVDTVACLLDTEQLDETGYLEDDPAMIAEPVSITQEDIRAVQLAKSAIHAGIRTLLHRAGIAPEAVGTLAIAGGFGSYLNTDNACKIGLLPAEMRPAIRVIGNAALAGAAMVLLSRDLREQCARCATGEVAELSTDPVFADEYMERMLF